MSLNEVFIPGNPAIKLEGSLVRPDIYRYADPSDYDVEPIGKTVLQEELSVEAVNEIELPVQTTEAA